MIDSLFILDYIIFKGEFEIIFFLWIPFFCWFPMVTRFSYYILVICIKNTVIDFWYFASSIKDMENIYFSLTNQMAIFLNANEKKKQNPDWQRKILSTTERPAFWKLYVLLQDTTKNVILIMSIHFYKFLIQMSVITHE